MNQNDQESPATEVHYEAPALPPAPPPEDPGSGGGFGGFPVRRLIGFAVVPVLLGAGYFLSDSGLEKDDTVRDENGNVIEGGDVGALALEEGDCLPASFFATTGTEVRDAPVVPCAEPHAGEVSTVHTMSESGSAPFPGDARIQEVAEQTCFARFEGYMGVPYSASELGLFWLFPTRQSWEELGDREITCVVTLPDGREQSGSFRNSRI